MNKRLPGARIAHLVTCLFFKSNKSNKELSDNFDSEYFGGTYHKDYFINWKFHSIYHSFQDIGWILKKMSFFTFQWQLILYGVARQLWSLGDFFGPYKVHVSNWKNLRLNLTVLKIYNVWEKLLTYPFVLFLVIAVILFHGSKTQPPYQFCEGNFMPNLVPIGQVVSDFRRFLKEITLKIAKKTSKMGNNSNMVSQITTKFSQ